MTIILTEDFTVYADETVEGDDGNGFTFAEGEAITFLNLGIVRVTSIYNATGVHSAPYAGQPEPATSFDNRGLLEVSSSSNTYNVYGFQYDSFSHTAFANTGEIRVTSGGGNAIGVDSPQGQSIVNRGAINVTVNGAGTAFGASAYNGMSIENFGEINAHVNGEGRAIGIYTSLDGNVVINHGTISATSPGFSGGSIGISVNSTFNFARTSPNIVNEGELSADIAILVTDGVFPSQEVGHWISNTGTIEGDIRLLNGDDRIDNSDAITGDIYFDAGADRLTNSAGGVITGNVSAGGGNDVIDTSAGVLIGDVLLGAGNDSFIGSTGADNVLGDIGDDELGGGGGNDVLSGGSGLDDLDGGEGTDNLNGGSAADSLNGGGGSDVLEGGTGADALIGGMGDDIYYVDNIGDTATEGGNAGRDTLVAARSWAVSSNFERVYLAGTDNFNLAGNGLDNVLRGNGGDNWLNGSFGKDVLTGGKGRDSFIFNRTLGPNNIDTITDYDVPRDVIRIDNAVFAGIGPAGALTAGMFNTGAAATEVDDRIIYDQTTGKLFFDIDGLGGAAQMHFATLSTKPTGMTASEFIVI